MRSLFTRVLPRAEKTGFFDNPSVIPTQKPENLETTQSNLIVDHERSTANFFDKMLDQYSQNLRHYQMDTSPDHVIRYAQGAMVNFLQEERLEMCSRLKHGLLPDFPGADDSNPQQIRDLTFVANKNPGRILDNYGTPVLARFDTFGDGRVASRINDELGGDQEFTM